MRIVCSLVAISLACAAEPTVGDTDAQDTSSSDGFGDGDFDLGGRETETETGDGDGDDPLAGCDMIAQDCPPGHKCVAYTTELFGDWVATACVEAHLDAGPIGSICFSGEDGFDTCGPDSMCLQLGTGEGVCFPLCQASATPGEPPSCPDAAGFSFNCERLDELQARPLAQGVHLCQIDCDPLANACPANIFGCYPGATRFSCRLSEVGPKPEGYACDDHLECASGTLCTDAGSGCTDPSCCARYCDVEAVGACETSVVGQDCVALFEPGRAPAGLELVGVCL